MPENDCPSCFAAPAVRHPHFGILPCMNCKARLDSLPTPTQQVEIIPDYIKKEREERQDSIEQPHVRGELNKRYVDLWGEKAARDRGFTNKEIKNAKYVYDGLRNKNSAVKYYKEST